MGSNAIDQNFKLTPLQKCFRKFKKLIKATKMNELTTKNQNFEENKAKFTKAEN